MVAWLITWEWQGGHAKVKDNIASILNYRLSSERVLEIVELLYANNKYDLSERLAYAKNKKNNPYPAEYHRIKLIRYMGRITCGHNPWLYARVVDNIRIEHNNDGREILKWDERPIPSPIIP